jgi:CheY-like chemotaxis protein
MTTSSRSFDVEPPGALEVETLGAHVSTSTETSSARSHPIAELVVEVESEHPTGGPVHKTAKKPRPVRSAAGTLRVLVADDSAGVRELLERALSEEGYEVVLACNGQEALEQFAVGLIDLVLLDLEMPVKSGWDVFEEMVAQDQDQAIVLMADRLDAVDLSTTGHLTRLAEKPINLTALLATVRKALSETAALRRSTISSQHNLLRYARPYVLNMPTVHAYEHWGIND